MNAIVKQLAQQAGMYVDLKGEPWPKWMGAEECELAYAKFAELIVSECAEHALTFNNNIQSNTDKVMRSNLNRVSDYIKDRMGVEL
jgi:hypothetical protein